MPGLSGLSNHNWERRRGLEVIGVCLGLGRSGPIPVAASRGGNRPALRLCQDACENLVPALSIEVRMPTIYDFRNRIAVVTGGAQGIGRAIAQRLLHGGAAVWLWDRDIALARAAAAELPSIREAFA